MTCSAKGIICDEIFDENSLPSDQEVRDYAVKIGINPDTEKHLLNIALDGLMSPLPQDWKPCLDERIDRIYYYNTKTHQTQWNHPLDEHFENLVKKKRQEESISAGDDDSKTSIKEDLKSFEEAVTTSEMMSSRNPLTTHKSRLSTAPQKSSSQAVKEPLQDGRKVLNPVGRPPLPPKRRAGSTSPKQGGSTGPERSSLSLRLSPAPSPTRIDIDSIGVPLGLSSPDVKSDKQTTSRSPAIKLTGGGSAFLKSKPKQTESRSDGTKSTIEDPVFGIVREAESIDSPDDDKVIDENRLKHSTSLGESGFDKLIKSKRFSSLQENLMSLKNELDLSNSENKSNSNAQLPLRSILREKPPLETKLWDIDPVLLSSEEKHKLRIQEMKDERKQNVRFADILNQPINIQFSKSDSEEDSSTNDSSNELEDLILEQLNSDDEIKKENRVSELLEETGMKTDVNENSNLKQTAKQFKPDDIFLNLKESNKNVLSRLTDLSTDRKNYKDENKKRIIEIENNNMTENEEWLTDKINIMNQNKQKIKEDVLANTMPGWDLENNTTGKHITDISFVKKKSSEVKDHQISSPKLAQYMEILDKTRFGSLITTSESSGVEQSKNIELKKVSWEDSNENSSGKLTRQLSKSKLMPEVDLQKVFDSVRESIINSTEHSDEEIELMQTSPLGSDDIQTALEQNEQDLRRMRTGVVHRTDDRIWEKNNRHQSKKFEEYKEQEKKLFEEKKENLQQEYEEILKGLRHQESLEKQRVYTEIQQSMARYKEEIEAEKNEREAQLRNECEDYIKDLEIMLTKDKEMRIIKMKEEHDTFLKEQEKKINETKIQFEEEKKIRLKTSSQQLEKIVTELKQKEEEEIIRLKEESNKKIDEVRKTIEVEQAEQEKRLKQELAIVESEFEAVLSNKKKELENLCTEKDAELANLKLQQEKNITQLSEQHRQIVQELQDQFNQEEELLRKKHSEKVDALNAQLNRASEKEDIIQVNREFEKVRCEKRLLEDKYKSLKEKYMRLKNEVRLSMERKRQSKLNRQLQQREQTSTTEDTTDRSTDHGKPPIARKKLTTTLSSDEPTLDNANGTPKTIKRRPKPQPSMTTSSATGESNSGSLAKSKNVWNPSPHQWREGASSTEDNHTSVSEEILLEKDDYVGEKWTQSALTPLDNLRKQLEKLDDLEEQFPTSVHTDTYLRYPFSGPAGASCELEFYRHRLHLERESVRRAKQALAEQRHNIESRQVQLRHKQHSEKLHHLHQEERELTDMEVSLHHTKALLGEKIIRLRFLEQSIERAASYTTHHSQDSTTNTNTDSSGFSGSDLDLSNNIQCPAISSDMFWTENVLQSLENINSEIREIWTILGKQQVPGLGPPPLLNYESRAIGQSGVDSYNLAPHRATDIADRTRRLKEWLIRTRDQQTQMIAPVTL